MLFPADATSMALASDELERSYWQLAAGTATCEIGSPVHYYRQLQLCGRFHSRCNNSAKNTSGYIRGVVSFVLAVSIPILPQIKSHPLNFYLFVKAHPG